jgi:hypothetical protein
VALLLLLRGAGLHAQTAVSQTGAPAARPTPAPIQIYQIDLDPSGRQFAFGKPSLQNDNWVFTQWPDHTVARVPRSQVKTITLWSKDLSKEVVYRIHLQPTGHVIARDAPVLKNGTFIFHTWTGGKIQSVRQADVRGIEKVTGVEAFKAQQIERGAARIGDLPMEGGGSVTIIGSPPAVQSAAPAASADPGGSTWIYQGKPGVTDAYAPPPAQVAYPGDVPKAAPVPTSPPH